MRSGIAFPHRRAHEAVHLRPLLDRLPDVVASQARRARVAVLAGGHPRVRAAWNVQVFRGLADPCCDVRALRRRSPIPRPAGGRRGRYEQVNAYGPRWADLFEDALPGTQVSRFGHGPLNETRGVHADPEGPLVWLPAPRRAGARQSGLEAFAGQVANLAAEVPILLKPHPRAPRLGRSAAALRRLAATRNVTVAPSAESPYRLLEGCRSVLADAGSLALEAFCAGLPVALASPASSRFVGLQAELAGRVPTFTPSDGGLAEWAQAPAAPADAAWARDLLFPPDPRRNDAFAARLRERAAGGNA